MGLEREMWVKISWGWEKKRKRSDVGGKVYVVECSSSENHVPKVYSNDLVS